jgi:hypothetical protein
MPKAEKARARSAVYDELTPAEIRDALKRRTEQLVEYGTWVASMDITVPFGASLAYTTGSPVPVSNVERWDYDKPTNYMGAVCVVLQDTAEGKALMDPNSTTARVAAVQESLGALNTIPTDVAATVDTSPDRAPSQTPAASTGLER